MEKKGWKKGKKKTRKGRQVCWRQESKTLVVWICLRRWRHFRLTKKVCAWKVEQLRCLHPRAEYILWTLQCRVAYCVSLYVAQEDRLLWHVSNSWNLAGWTWSVTIHLLDLLPLKLEKMWVPQLFCCLQICNHHNFTFALRMDEAFSLHWVSCSQMFQSTFGNRLLVQTDVVCLSSKAKWPKKRADLRRQEEREDIVKRRCWEVSSWHLRSEALKGKNQNQKRSKLRWA